LTKKKDVKGDKLRNVMFFVYLHEKFSKDKIKVADLKKTIGYSTGGIYSAFESDYLEKEQDKIHLTEEGEDYVTRRILPQFDVYRSYGFVLIIFGLFFFLQWFLWVYARYPMIPSWWFPLMLLAFGLFLRFFALRFDFILIKRRKKMELP
jgi:hypothetical protein